uniref:Uncharacterized protein n=1 Tax=Trieres chinensis TaxID=1514140 RepID=A0A7S1Z425_TRICV
MPSHDGPSAAFKFGGLLLLLLCVAPLPSLYHLFSRNLSVDESYYARKTLEVDSVLTDPSATLEDLIRVVLTESLAQRSYGMAILAALSAASDHEPLGLLGSHPLSVVLPWLVSVIIVLIVTVAMFFRERRSRDFLRSLKGKKRRLARIILCVRDYRRVVQPSDFRPGSDAVDGNDNVRGVKKRGNN